MDLKIHIFNRGITAMRGKQCIAVARDKRPHGWMLTGYGLCWLAAKDRRAPWLLLVKTKKEAMGHLKSLR